MQKIFTYIKNDRALKANVILVGGSLLANVGAYLYHLFMGRLLVPTDYGALQSLISLSNVFNVPLAMVNTVVVKFVSSYVGRGDREKVTFFYHSLNRYFLIIAIVGSVIFLLFTKPVLAFLHIESWINYIILDIALFVGLISILNRATLQGLSQFFYLTIVQTIESFGKLLFGVITVLIGWTVPGAFGSFVAVIFLSIIYMRWVLKKSLPKHEETGRLPYRSLIGYAIPSLLMTVSVVSLFNMDVVLVRHFLSAHESGMYSALSVLGKIIFFGSAPVAVAMFPMISEAHERGEAYQRTFLLSLAFTLFLAGTATTIFSIAPDTTIRVLIGSQYLAAAELLSRFSIFLSLCAVINLFMNFFLSIRKTFPIVISVAGAILQAVLLWNNHGSLEAMVTTSLLVTAAITVGLGISYVYVTRT